MRDFWKDITHFSPAEFDSPDEPNSGRRMDPEFMDLLDCARDIAGIPFRISQGGGYRTEQYNRDLIKRNPLASPRSLHMEGKAADIVCSDNRDRALIIDALSVAGLRRFGISRTFIHVDAGSPDRRSPSMWVY